MKKISLKLKLICMVLSLIMIIVLCLILNTSGLEVSKNEVSDSSLGKMLEKPEGIQAFTLQGKQTNLDYSDLISKYIVGSITCKNGTIGTYNEKDNSVTLSNIKMPDYCTMNFKVKDGATIYDKLMADNPIIKTRTDFSTTYGEKNYGVLFKGSEKLKTSSNAVYASWNSYDNVCLYSEQEVKYIASHEYLVNGNDLYATESKCYSTPVCHFAEYDFAVGMDYETCYELSNILYTNGEIDKIPEDIGNLYGVGDEDVYYFAGNAQNNWVYFAGFYWRIIRTNADGSIRLLYSGTSPDTTEGYIGESAFNENTGSPKYAGYMYGDDDSTLDGIRANTNDSTIKSVIDSWYSKNLIDYDDYLSKEATYCNDREVSDNFSYTTNDYFTYASFKRLYRYEEGDSVEPSFNCKNSKDAFSGINTKAKLTYPIGLMTADEISFAGGLVYNVPSAWYSLNSSGESITNFKNWWLFSALGFSEKVGSSGVFSINDYEEDNAIGVLMSNESNESLYIRPVISIKGSLIWSEGDGSPDNPYIVKKGNYLRTKLLADNPTILTEDGSLCSKDTLYSSTESIAGGDAKTVYYFAGIDDSSNSCSIDNWVNFGEFYWRIIRTNHDGSIRLLYAGTSPDTTTPYLDTSVFNEDHDSPKYVGYMYGLDDSTLDGIRANTINSTIKTYIDNWYENNLKKYTKYLSKDAVYCNDRELASDSTYSNDSDFEFAAGVRNDVSSPSPTYNCSNIKDAFSGNNSYAKLKYPIALMTADEAIFAGADKGSYSPSFKLWFSTNSSGTIVNGGNWLMTPDYYQNGGFEFILSGSSLHSFFIRDYQLTETKFITVRPVISLSSDVIYSKGDGSSSNPYTILYN